MKSKKQSNCTRQTKVGNKTRQIHKTKQSTTKNKVQIKGKLQTKAIINQREATGRWKRETQEQSRKGQETKESRENTHYKRGIIRL